MASIRESIIEGVFEFTPHRHFDARGSFSELFKFDLLHQELMVEFNLAQSNVSKSNLGTLRGIHFQKWPPGQAKYVTAMSGRVIDVVVDLRRNSETFGKFDWFELDSETLNSVYIPAGIGHGFLAISDQSQVHYLCDRNYDPSTEMSINPLSLGIPWETWSASHEIPELILSEKDRNAPSLQEVMKRIHF